MPSKEQNMETNNEKKNSSGEDQLFVFFKKMDTLMVFLIDVVLF